MTTNNDIATPPRRGFRLVRRVRVARSLVLGLGATCAAGVLYQLHSPLTLWSVLLLHGFIWPQLAYVLAMRAREPYRWEMNQLALDAFMVGVWVPLMHFNTLPSAVSIAMTAMSLAGIGGRPLLLRGFLFQALAIVVGGMATGWQFQPLSTQLNVLTCLPMIVLYPTAIGALTYQLASRLSQQRNELDYISKHDGLSGLFNRMHWETLVRDEFLRGQRQRTPAVLILADIDHFKAINDQNGHAAGDEAIRRFAMLLRANVREIDRAARYGGEEFAVLLPNTGLVEATEIAERLRERLARAPLIENRIITASFGVAELRAEFVDVDAWIETVDAALYRAKQRGRDCVVMQAPTVVVA